MADSRVVLLSTGGTIEMVGTDSGLDIRPGRSGLPAGGSVVPDGVTLEHRELFSLPSPHMTPQRMAQLVCAIGEERSRGEVSGVVVTHGTDTLEESAFLADVLLPPGKPVAFTAAMRSASELGVDGPRNVMGAIRTVCTYEFHNLGVTVVLNDEVHSALRVTKTYTSNVSSFASPGYGPLGYVDADRVLLRRRPALSLDISARARGLEERVALVKLAAGYGAEQLAAAVEAGSRGIALEAFGRGNAPPDVAAEVGRAVEAGVVVAVTSRCYMGRVLGVYAYEGGGADLAGRGAVMAGDLPGPKLRLLLMVCLGAGMGAAEIANVLSLF
jgi:L-asparaginase